MIFAVIQGFNRIVWKLWSWSLGFYLVTSYWPGIILILPRVNHRFIRHGSSLRLKCCVYGPQLIYCLHRGDTLAQTHLKRKFMKQQSQNTVEHKRNRSLDFLWPTDRKGQAVAKLVEALCYKPEGPGFDSRWGHWILQLTYSFQPHYDPCSTQPLTEMSIRNLPGGKRRPVSA
jgi:hypothetical protein